MRLLQLRQVKCHPFIPLKSLSSSSSLPRQFRSRIHEIRAREEQESILIFSPEGEGNASQRVRPLRRLQLVRLEFPRDVHLVSLSRVVVRSLARSPSVRRFFLANFNRSSPIRGGRRTRRTANAPENVGNLRPSGIGNTLPIQERLTVRTSARPTDRIIGKRERGGVKTTGRGRHAIPSWTKIYMFVGAENEAGSKRISPRLKQYRVEANGRRGNNVQE